MKEMNVRTNRIVSHLGRRWWNLRPARRSADPRPRYGNRAVLNASIIRYMPRSKANPIIASAIHVWCLMVIPDTSDMLMPNHRPPNRRTSFNWTPIPRKLSVREKNKEAETCNHANVALNDHRDIPNQTVWLPDYNSNSD